MRPFSFTGFYIEYVSQVFARRRLFVSKKFPSMKLYQDECQYISKVTEEFRRVVGITEQSYLNAHLLLVPPLTTLANPASEGGRIYCFSCEGVWLRCNGKARSPQDRKQVRCGDHPDTAGGKVTPTADKIAIFPPKTATA